MATISGVGAGGLSAAAPNAFSELTSEEFVKIMFTELSNQDPLKPNDSTALLEQLSSLRSIQSDLELTKQLNALVTRNELSSAAALIGHTVRGLDESNLRVSGVVRAVARTSDGPVLILDNGFRVPFSGVDEMYQTPSANPPGGGTPTNPPGNNGPDITPRPGEGED